MVLAHNIEEVWRTKDVKITENVTFESMLLSSRTVDGLTQSGFHKPSPIQLHGIPLGKCGFDLLLEAKSGTGKTAVFGIIALEKIDINKGLQTIILAPTREIASQISDVIKQIGSYYEGLNVQVVMGGIPVHEDVIRLKNRVHILVGSPGRLRHLIQDKHIDTSSVRLLVLDEADMLIEKSFLTDINYIFSSLPHHKQVIMSSATYPQESKSIITQYMQNSQHICPDTTSILLGIAQKFTIVKSNTNIVRQTQYRFEELLKILSKFQFKQCLVFCNYQARVGEVFKMLTKEKWPAEQLCGQQDQIDRLDALKTLQQYKCRLLICTDLAARGIDASNVDLVINFEPPYEWQTYLHRIGRAGRFGSYGTAITILSQDKEENNFRKILNTMGCTINLTNLWTSQTFFGKTEVDSNDDQSIRNPLDTFKSGQELYKLATNAFTDLKLTDLEQDSNHIHQPLVIESFSDLLESFQNNDIDNDIDDCSQFHSFLIPKDTKNCEDIVNFTEEGNLSPIDQYLSHHQEDNKVQTVQSIQEVDTIESNDITEKQKENFEMYNLPSSFQSKKETKILKSSFKSSIVDGKKEKRIPIQAGYVNNINETEEKYVKLLEKHNHGKNKIVHRKPKQRNTERTQVKSFDSTSYNTWFNQLKINMKQIEMAIYLEELTSL